MAIEIRVFSDYVCPFCYLGKGILERLSEEYDLEVTPLGYELHPSTAPLGVPLAELFPAADIDALFAAVRERAAELGLPFGRPEILPNSRLALEAAEYARDRGCLEEFHNAVFHAYFAEGQNIGRFRVLAPLAERCGLDPKALRTVLESRIYAPRLEAIREEASRMGVRGIPFFVIARKLTREGAGELDDFRAALDSLLKTAREEKRP